VFWRQHQRKMFLLVVYVDIIITVDDAHVIVDLKCYLQKHCKTKDLKSLRYFLGIEVARSRRGITLSQRKYVLDILSEACMLGCRDADALIEANVKLLLD